MAHILARWLRTTVLGQGPRYPGDLFWLPVRESRKATLQTLVCLPVIGVPGIAVALTARTQAGRQAGFVLALLGCIGLLMVRNWWLERRRAQPVAELLLWWTETSLREWHAIDGGDLPPTLDRAVVRLAEKTGDLATARRLSALLAKRDWGAVRTGLDSWKPTDPAFDARRAFLMSALQFDQESIDDSRDVMAAAGRISDPNQRLRQETFVAIEQARRNAIRGLDPVPTLVEARRNLGGIKLDPLPTLVETQHAFGSSLGSDVFRMSERYKTHLIAMGVIWVLMLLYYVLGAVVGFAWLAHRLLGI